MLSMMGYKDKTLDSRGLRQAQAENLREPQAENLRDCLKTLFFATFSLTPLLERPSPATSSWGRGFWKWL
jgi:hypothetical protein